MKTSLRTTLLSALAGLCLALNAGLAVGQVLYSNGPINGKGNAYDFDGGLAVSDTFALAGKSNITGFDLGVWVVQGDTPLTANWSITSNAFGGTVYASGISSFTNVFHNSWTQGQLSTVWNVYDSFVSLSMNVGAGTYWLNVTNGTSSHERGMFWDINSGVGCEGSDGQGADCPSLAQFNLAGPIDSESFTIIGTQATPEPGTLALLGTGVLGLSGYLRRRLRG
jgi:PEP-CTERM motif